MAFLSAQGFATQMIALSEPRQGVGGRRGPVFLPEDGFQSFDDQVFDGGAAARGGNLRLLK